MPPVRTIWKAGLRRSHPRAVMLASGLLWVVSDVRAAAAFDMREGVTEISRRVQALHHLSFAVCVVVGIIVFGAMFYSAFAHRRSFTTTSASKCCGR